LETPRDFRACATSRPPWTAVFSSTVAIAARLPQGQSYFFLTWMPRILLKDLPFLGV
jgi:hypothetical protein